MLVSLFQFNFTLDVDSRPVKHITHNITKIKTPVMKNETVAANKTVVETVKKATEEPIVFPDIPSNMM